MYGVCHGQTKCWLSEPQCNRPLQQLARIFLTCIRTVACLMGQYCFARWRLSSSLVVCNAAGGPAGWPAGRRALGQSGGRQSTAGQSCYVPLGRHFVNTNGKTISCSFNDISWRQIEVLLLVSVIISSSLICLLTVLLGDDVVEYVISFCISDLAHPKISAWCRL